MSYSATRGADPVAAHFHQVTIGSHLGYKLADKQLRTSLESQSLLSIWKACMDAERPLASADATRLGIAIRQLAARNDNWDGRGSAAAKPAAIDRALTVIDTHAHQVRQSNLSWQDPHVTLSEDGDVVLEWWQREKRLTLYITPTTTEYVSSWGLDVDDHMEAGELDVQRGQMLHLWQWLLIPLEK